MKCPKCRGSGKVPDTVCYVVRRVVDGQTVYSPGSTFRTPAESRRDAYRWTWVGETATYSCQSNAGAGHDNTLLPCAFATAVTGELSESSVSARG